MTFRDYVEGGNVIAGSPETVAGKIRELVKELRIGQLITMMQTGNMSEELTNKNTYLFATEVMPKIRDIWSEYPDYWTPQKQQAAAAV